MKWTLRGFVTSTGTLALASGLLFATAVPAFAAAPNRAYAASARGLINHRPIKEARYPGKSPKRARRGAIPGLITTGPILDKAGPVSASSRVANVTASIGKLVYVRATWVRSSCVFDTNTARVRGTTFMQWGRVTGGLPLTFAFHPHPNTHLLVPGIGIITLNRQTRAKDGTLTVQAIYAVLTRGQQRLSIGVSVCNKANLAPVPILPGRSAQMALGALGLALLFGVGYRISVRRRRTAAA
jgi:hypothetical protein